MWLHLLYVHCFEIYLERVTIRGHVADVLYTYRYPHKNVSTFIFRMGFQGLYIRRESVEYILIAPTYPFSMLCKSAFSFLFKIIDLIKADSMFQGDYVLMKVTVHRY